MTKRISFTVSNFDGIASTEEFFKILGKNDICACEVKFPKAGKMNMLKFILCYESFKRLNLTFGILEDKRIEPLFHDRRITQDVELLHDAVQREHALTLIKLIKQANLTTKDSRGFTPLHTAADGGHMTSVKILLMGKDAAVKADINSQNKLGRTPLHLAAANGHLKVVQLLLDAGAKADIVDQSGNTACHVAIHKKHSMVINLLKAHTSFDSDSLHIVVQNNHPEEVKKILDSKVDPNASKNFFPPIFVAVQKGFAGVVKILLEAKADPNKINEKAHDTPFYSINSEMNTQPIVQLLIEYKGDINQDVGAPWFTPLYTAISQRKISFAKILLEAKADPTYIRKDTNYSLLHLAAFRGVIELVQPLISNGAPVHHVDEDGQSALDIAIIFKHSVIANYFLNMGIYLRGLEENAFFYSIENAMFEVVENILNIRPKILNQKYYDEKYTALHIFVIKNQFESVKFLLTKKTNVNAVSKDNQTPLHLAARQANIPVIKLLLDYGADSNITFDDGIKAFDLLPIHMQKKPEIAALFNVSITPEWKPAKIISHPEAKKQISFSFEEEYRLACKKLAAEREHAMPSFPKEEADLKQVIVAPQLSVDTLSCLFGKSFPENICLIKDLKNNYTFVALHPDLEEKIEKGLWKKLNDYLKSGAVKFIPFNSREIQGIKPLKGIFLMHPKTGKKRRLYELKLLNTSLRLFGIIEKINDQFVLNFAVYDNDPHSSQAKRKNLKSIKEKLITNILARGEETRTLPSGSPSRRVSSAQFWQPASAVSVNVSSSFNFNS